MIVDELLDRILDEYAIRFAHENATRDEAVAFLNSKLTQVHTGLRHVAASDTTHGILDVAYLPFFPVNGLKLFGSERQVKYGFCEQYHHKSYRRQTHFALRPRDGEWLSFYVEQFRSQWRSASRRSRLTGAGQPDSDLI
jgi:hypothetical protein